MINIKCANCSKEFNLKDDMVGKTGKCTCGNIFSIENNIQPIGIKTIPKVTPVSDYSDNLGIKSSKESGGIFSKSINFFKDNLMQILAFGLAFSIPLNTITNFLINAKQDASFKDITNIMKLKNLVWLFVTLAVINFVFDKNENINSTIYSSMKDGNKKFGSAFYIGLIIGLMLLLFIIPIFFIAGFAGVSMFKGDIFDSIGTLIIVGIIGLVVVGFAMYMLTRYSFAFQNLLYFGDKGDEAIKKSISQVKGNWWKVFGIKLLTYAIPISAGLILGFIGFGENMYFNIITDTILDIFDIFMIIVLSMLFIKITGITTKEENLIETKNIENY